MWQFVDGSHNNHSGSRFWRDGESKTADLIRWAYCKTGSDSSTANTLPPAISDTTFHMQASDLWDHIRAKHTGITPASSWNPSQDSLPPASAPALPPINFCSNSSRVYFLLQSFHATTLARMDGDVTAFANQLCGFEHRVKKLGSYLPAYQMKMQFLYNLEPEYRPKLRELEAAYGVALWRDQGGLEFEVLREVMVAEERRLREEASQREAEEVGEAAGDKGGEGQGK
ncbi:hypothetical protein GTA08_BOTSDO02726 [Neofusicoccum parvum]|nr:hypothetical protein GTA08_BOTSDO02726 [Neofusicoccum parvum]